MNATVVKHPKCLTDISVTFPAEEVTKETASITNAYSTKAQIPGFRPGKAPKRVIEKRYGKEIEGELEHNFLNKVLQHTVKEEGINFLNIKDQNCTHEENGDLAVKVSVIVAPDFELPEYKNVAITAPKMEVTDEVLENEILNIRRQQAQYPTKEEGGVEQDDIAVISYTSTFDGKPSAESFEESLAPYDAQEDYWIKAGGDHFLPGFSENLISMVVGSEKVIAHTFADDFALEALRGKTLDYTVTVKEIKAEELESEEELAKKMLGEEGTVEAFREQVKSYVEGQQAKSLQDIKSSAILEKIGEGLEFEVPEDYLASEKQSQANGLIQQAMSYGMGEEEVAKMQENILETATANAEKSLKNHFLLQKIAEEEKMEVTSEEIMQKVAMQAYQSGQDPQKAIKELQKSGNDYQVRQSILMDKVVAFLVEEADITEETEQK